jgi:N-acetylglucosamine-6-phosphate deacetylase
MMELITNGRVLLPSGEIAAADIRITDGLIADTGCGLAGDNRFDAGGRYVLPGLVDIHTHGLGFSSAEIGSLADWAKTEAASGATCFFPTLFGPPESLIEHFERHRRETDELRAVPQVGGFRLESPYLAHVGGGPSESLAQIDPSLTERLLEAGGGHIRIWDISPELSGACETIADLTRRGIVCSLAHTHATIEQARAAVDAGATLVTHLFDTFEAPHMADPGVYPAGLVDYLLVEDRVTCEIIADGTHVHPLLVEQALRCKGPERLAFVTDSNYGSGLPPGDYDLPDGWGRARITDRNLGIRLVDRDLVLAGSALAPLDVLRNAVKLFGQDLAVASRLCSGVPADLLGLNAGRIAVGRDADLIILDDKFSLWATISKGRIVWRQEQA